MSGKPRKSDLFEQKTMLPYRAICEFETVNFSDANRSVITHLKRKPKRYVKQLVSIDNLPGFSFIITSKYSFQFAIVDCGMANYLPVLPSGIKQPDEFYINDQTKTVFVIEKKTQSGGGSVDEKIQTGAFKKFILSRKFKKC